MALGAGNAELAQRAIRLRPLRPGDLIHLHRIDVACFTAPFRFSKASLKLYLEEPQAIVLLAERDESLAGFIIVHLQDEGGSRSGYVVTLDVLREHRRFGVGAHLLLRAERLAALQSASAMRLHVFAGNPAARRFYARMGYGLVSTVAGFYGDALDALLLNKPLSGVVAI